jgi:hypothetical protein
MDGRTLIFVKGKEIKMDLKKAYKLHHAAEDILQRSRQIYERTGTLVDSARPEVNYRLDFEAEERALEEVVALLDFINGALVRAKDQLGDYRGWTEENLESII